MSFGMIQTLLALSTPRDLGGSFGCIGGYCPGEVSGGSGTGSSQITVFASNLFGFFTTIAGLMFILYFVLGGLAWITAGGDTQKVDKAKSQMTNAAIGLIVVVAAWAIAFIVGAVLGLDILDPGSFLNGFMNIPSTTEPAGMR